MDGGTCPSDWALNFCGERRANMMRVLVWSKRSIGKLTLRTSSKYQLRQVKGGGFKPRLTWVEESRGLLLS